MATGLLELLKLKPLNAGNPVPAAGPQPPPPSGSAAPAAAPAGTPGAPADPPTPPVDDERTGNNAKRLIVALSKGFDENITRAQAAVSAQPVDTLKKSLGTELDAFATTRAAVDKAEPLDGARMMKKLDSDAHRFALRAEALRKSAADGVQYLRERGDLPYADLKATLDAQAADIQAVYRPRLDQVKTWLDACRPLLDKGEIDKLIDSVGRVYIQGQDLKRAIVQHAAAKPEYDALRAEVVAMIQRMRDSKLLDADGLAGLAELDTAVAAADALGPVRGFGAAKNSLNAVIGKALVLRDNNDAYRDYVVDRDKVVAALKPLRAHPQAGKLSVEIARVDKLLADAEKLSRRVDGGALKALTALIAIAAEGENLKKLAARLATAEKKLPALSKKLADGGVPKDKLEETARMSLKILVEEGCSDDDAVKMAKDASGFRGEGMDEQDAMMSSRIKKSLEGQGLVADHAAAIGRNIRAGGSATGDDAKALATSMKGMSKKAIETLTKAKIHTECCRGAITDAFPDLAGVKPTGWPETATWDQVPGVYDGNRNTLVVGTIDDGSGKRTVPGTGKGHGAIDLFGHEAGHAFDAADGGGKRNHADFTAAREADKASGALKGKRDHGPDNYFLKETEGGTNTKGAIGETFAESFAFHTSRKPTRWLALKGFWLANPWGI
ncbi:MAG: hypothetical protein ABIQ06_15105 [Caldimonas sp.]